ncbi:sulfatase-like hydrolase/transferase [Helicobacter brantae]|uniref:Sulfatase N-terminal domain-containing protein n=1 Tax=Helicobacter brantae TaxID=375927 RepID=A0A3D8J0Q8_9HELI|nr:sulfatase-like hydrolase/transferase [Helicobacter brantae]RDU70361.1 hypothetical protein CQA58_05880 [Helicobacter brantae]
MRLEAFFKYTLFAFVLFIGITGRWLHRSFGTITYDQLRFHTKISFLFEGLEPTFYYDFFNHCIFPFVTFLLIYYLLRRFFFLKNKKRRVYENVFFVILIASFSVAAQKFWHFDNLYAQSKLTQVYGDFYEKHYEFPKQENIVFPKEKRNLIVIFAESMESTFLPNTLSLANTQEEDFSPFGNLASNLGDIASQNIVFSDTESIGGAEQAFGVTWTIAGLVAYNCGIPLTMPIDTNQFGRIGGNFLGGAVCLGNMLDKEGYKQTFLVPHPKNFSGVGPFLKDHKIAVKDVDTYKKLNELPQDYQGFWGMKDSLTLDKAKKELTNLKKDTPFALYILTIDTHASTGYTDLQKCTQKYGEQTPTQKYKNAISCSDSLIGEFVEWAKTQDFYKNTTIVILGDHLSMNAGFFPSNAHRRIYNAFINAKFFNPIQADKIYNRRFSHFDILPTILDSLDVEVRGGRLGLGSDLLSNQPTLLELYNGGGGGYSKKYSKSPKFMKTSYIKTRQITNEKNSI